MAPRLATACMLIAQAAPPAHAPEPPALQLHWQAPATCPQREDVREALAARQGDPQGNPPVLVVAHGDVAEHGGSYALTLRIQTPDTDRTRVVEAPSCDALGEAAALIIALAAKGRADTGEPHDSANATTSDYAHDPSSELANADASDDDRSEARPQERAARSPEQGETTVAASTKLSRRVSLGARVGAGLGFGALPSAGADFELAGWLAIRWFRVELPVRGQPPRPARYPPPNSGGANIARWGLGPRLCGVPEFRALQFPLCTGAEFGGMIARGVGLPVTRRAHLPWVAAFAGAGIEWSVGAQIALFARAEVGVPLVRPMFTSDTMGVVYHADRVVGALFVGVNFRGSRRFSRAVSNHQG